MGSRGIGTASRSGTGTTKADTPADMVAADMAVAAADMALVTAACRNDIHHHMGEE